MTRAWCARSGVGSYIRIPIGGTPGAPAALLWATSGQTNSRLGDTEKRLLEMIGRSITALLAAPEGDLVRLDAVRRRVSTALRPGQIRPVFQPIPGSPEWRPDRS